MSLMVWYWVLMVYLAIGLSFAILLFTNLGDFQIKLSRDLRRMLELDEVRVFLAVALICLWLPMLMTDLGDS